MPTESKYTPNENVASIHQILSFSWFGFAVFALLLTGAFWKEPVITVWSGSAAVAFLVLGGFHYLVSEGAKKKRPWARVTSIIYAVLVFLGFPVFTFISVFLFKHMRWDDE